MASSLILGALHSGKSRFSRSLLSAGQPVTRIVPPGGALHEIAWEQPDPSVDGVNSVGAVTTVTSLDLTRALLNARTAVVIDSLTHWANSLIDSINGWEDPERTLTIVNQRLDELSALWISLPVDIVAVSTELGWGLGASPSSQLLREVMAIINQRLGAASDRVYLVIGGRVVDLSSYPRVD